MLAATSLVSQGAESLAYGIRVEYGESEIHQTLVAFPTDNPADVSEILDLAGYVFRAATCHNDVYYMIHSDDGLTGASFVTLDLNTKKITTVKVFDWKTDLAANIIFSDMTYDESTGKIYAGGYDLKNVEIIDGVPNAPFSILTLDPATGESESIGSQDVVALSALGADEYGLKGIDMDGVLWEVSKYSGHPDFEWISTGFTAAGLQSMTYDTQNRCWYWAAAVEGDGGALESKLIRLTEVDYEFSYENLGNIGGGNEIVGLYIDPSPLPQDAPAVPKDLTATPASLGVAETALNWTSPTLTIGGKQLEGDITLNIYRDDILLASLKDCVPGAEMTWTDSDVETGLHTYSVSATNDVAEGKRCYSEEIWVGEDMPGAVTGLNAVLSDDASGIRISWEKPTAGCHGGWFDESSLTYTLVRYPDSKILIDNGNLTEYTDTEIAEMHGYYYELTPATKAGAGIMEKTAPIVAGKPHEVPYEPDFNNSDDALQWKVADNDGDGYSWYTDSGWAGTYDVFFRYYPEATVNPEATADDWLISPPVHLYPGKYYVAEYDVRLLGELFPANTQLAIGTSPEISSMTRILESNEAEINDIEWVRHAVPFTVDSEGNYHFSYRIMNLVPVQFYKFRILEVPQHDLEAVALKGDAIIGTDDDTEYTVEIRNNGFHDATEYKVRIVDGEGNILNETLSTEIIPARMSTFLPVTFRPEAEGKLTIAPEVEIADDENPDNNRGESREITVINVGTTVTIAEEPLTATPSAPIYAIYNHSAVQTIYTNDLFEIEEGSLLKGLTYHISDLMGGIKEEYVTDLKLCVAEVDNADFFAEEMLPENEFTTVYDGKLSVAADSKTMTVIFDTPMEYHGGNICIFARHSSDMTSNLMFEGTRPGTDTPYHSCLYNSSTDAFDYSMQTRGSKELPKVTILIEKPQVGIDSAIDTETPALTYDRQARLIRIAGEYAECEIHSMTGLKLGSYRDVREIATTSLTESMVIVELTTTTGRKAYKIRL